MERNLLDLDDGCTGSVAFIFRWFKTLAFGQAQGTPIEHPLWRTDEFGTAKTPAAAPGGVESILPDGPLNRVTGLEVDAGLLNSQWLASDLDA